MTATARTRLNRGILGRLRLASQGLAGPGCRSAPAAVRWMTAMQAQDLQSALWAVGQRVPGSGVADVRGALDRGEIVRSWPMRGTLHLLAPEDLKWLLAITSDRLIRGLARRHRELHISTEDIDAAAGTASQLVSGGAAASRAELFQGLEAAGQPTAGQRGVHLFGMLCQRGLLVQGPLAGNQQLLVAFDDWITMSRHVVREEGITEWLLRYLRSHGPATERDFSWWSGIPLTEVRAALVQVMDQLVELKFEGVRYWLSQETAALLDEKVPAERQVLALPGFDEFLLGYMDRSLVLAPEHAAKIVPGGNGIFRKTVVAGGRVVGTWGVTGHRSAAVAVPVPFDRVNGLAACSSKVL